jgi:hypothetical protein
MSDTDHPPLAPPPVPPPPRSGCLTAFMVIVGFVLLLPGVCVLAVTNLYSDPLFGSVFGSVAIVASIVGIGGITLIWRALRGPRR